MSRSAKLRSELRQPLKQSSPRFHFDQERLPRILGVKVFPVGNPKVKRVRTLLSARVVEGDLNRLLFTPANIVIKGDRLNKVELKSALIPDQFL